MYSVQVATADSVLALAQPCAKPWSWVLIEQHHSMTIDSHVANLLYAEDAEQQKLEQIKASKEEIEKHRVKFDNECDKKNESTKNDPKPK